MSRTAELEARRKVLLARCEEQRAELAYRFEQIRPAAQVASWTRSEEHTSELRHALTSRMPSSA